MSILSLRTATSRRSAIAGALCLGLLPVAANAAPEKENTRLSQAVKKTILLFPFDSANLAAANKSDVINMIQDVAASRLTASGQYSVTRFSKNNPSIARLRDDQLITDADASEPYAEDNRKSIKISKQTGHEFVLIGSVDDYKYDAARKSASLTLSGRLLETETGKIVKSVTLSGNSTSGGNADEDDRALEAARSTGERLLAQLVPMTVAPQPIPVEKPKSTKKPRRNNDWIWAVLVVGLGVGLGIGLSGGGSGGGNDNPPPPPGN
jgi:hypothetical protein